MKSDANNQSWRPTLTLAKLFEEQNQFYDALAIYEIIGQTDSSPEVRQKIELLQARILNDPNLRYDPRIEKLFSPEELAYLKILNHSAFENLSRIHLQFERGTSDYEVILGQVETEEICESPVLEEQDISGISESAIDKEEEAYFEVLGDEPADEQKVIDNSRPEASEKTEELTVDQLGAELIKRFGKDSRLNDISVQEFIALLQEFNLLSKFKH